MFFSRPLPRKKLYWKHSFVFLLKNSRSHILFPTMYNTTLTLTDFWLTRVFVSYVFSGQVLVNWLVSSFGTDERRRDARLLLPQICTDLLCVGVIKQIRDKDAPVVDVFRVSAARVVNDSRGYYCAPLPVHSHPRVLRRFFSNTAPTHV